ncbi:MAG: hypothetical protein JWR16_153 [Nevskia sp.]|nr:hypothetical protein [Nevskia sp.]
MIGSLAFVAVAVILVGTAAWMLVLARDTERAEDVRERLQTFAPSEETDLPTAQNRKLRNPIIRWIVQLFWRAGAEVSSLKVVQGLVAAVIVAALIFAIGGVLGGGLIVAGVLVLVYVVLLRLGVRHRQRIVEQLPTFLESVIRVLAAGNSLEESFGAAARESANPIRPLFVSVVRQVKLGAPIEQVLTEMGTAYRLRDLRVLGLAANVNRRYGGSIRAVLKSMITGIRQRSMAARELRALTAETRFSALVLAVIPIGLTLHIYSRNPQYYATMFRDPSGKILLIATVVLQLAGVLVLWRMLSSTKDVES